MSGGWSIQNSRGITIYWVELLTKILQNHPQHCPYFDFLITHSFFGEGGEIPSNHVLSPRLATGAQGCYLKQILIK